MPKVKFCVCPSFPYGIEGGMWDVVVLISDYCLSIYFAHSFVVSTDKKQGLFMYGSKLLIPYQQYLLNRDHLLIRNLLPYKKILVSYE